MSFCLTFIHMFECKLCSKHSSFLESSCQASSGYSFPDCNAEASCRTSWAAGGWGGGGGGGGEGVCADGVGRWEGEGVWGGRSSSQSSLNLTFLSTNSLKPLGHGQ